MKVTHRYLCRKKINQVAATHHRQMGKHCCLMRNEKVVHLPYQIQIAIRKKITRKNNKENIPQPSKSSLQHVRSLQKASWNHNSMGLIQSVEKRGSLLTLKNKDMNLPLIANKKTEVKGRKRVATENTKRP